MTNLVEGRPEPQPTLLRPVPGGRAQRRAALLCLQAAGRTADPVEQSRLRRRAAQLILPGVGCLRPLDLG